MVAPAPAVKLYGHPIATCTRRVAMVLEEKQVPYTIEIIELGKGQHKTPEYLAMQPFGKIPVLQDGDFQMFETRAMSRYIAKKWASQGTDLLGKTAEQQALVDNWVEVESQYLYEPIGALVYEKVFKLWHGHTTDEEKVKTELVKLEKVLDVYEAKLAKTAYVAGPDFSLADVVCMSYMDYLFNTAKVTGPLETRPHLKAWWEKISARPTWQKVIATKAP